MSTSGLGLDADLADKIHKGSKGHFAFSLLHHVSQKTASICKWCSCFQMYGQPKYWAEAHISSKGELCGLYCLWAAWQTNLEQVAGRLRFISVLHFQHITGRLRQALSSMCMDGSTCRLPKAQSNQSLRFILPQWLYPYCTIFFMINSHGVFPPAAMSIKDREDTYKLFLVSV